jgi:hypothetical protein
MSYPTITEKYGSLSASGLAKEVTFGTPVAATTFLPMTGNTMELDPGWFSPELMMDARDLHVFNLYGQAKLTGALDGPVFPSNAMALTAASIGMDGQPGFGVIGTAGTGSSTSSGSVIAGATTINVVSATGFTMNQIIQIDVNNTTGPTTAEVRKITNIATNTLTLDQPLTYGHATGVAVSGVIAPFTHTFLQTNTLPSLTVEKNIGNFQSLQFAGCRVGKMSVKAPTSNEPVTMTADLSGQSVAVLNSPTAVSVTNENPYVFAEATLTVFGTQRFEVSNVEIEIDNGLKETYTYSGQHGPSFITPVTVHASGKIDLVFSSLNDATYGDYLKMVNGTTGALSLTLVHPSSGGTVTYTCPQVVLAKYANDLKMTDVVMSSLSFEATRPLTGTSQWTIGATVANSVYLPY